jgi:transcriptional regulator with XRE-family HTH domain
MELRYDRDAIRRLREKRKLTMQQLADKAGITGRTLSYIEKAYSDPRASTLAKLATALGVSVGALFIRKDKIEQAA